MIISSVWQGDREHASRTSSNRKNSTSNTFGSRGKLPINSNEYEKPLSTDFQN
jgi:hypothetical protein